MNRMSAAIIAALTSVANMSHIFPAYRQRFQKNSTRIRTGKTYPHSSKRQQARYARQIAANQLNFHPMPIM